MSFFTGLSFNKGTNPGFTQSNEKFVVCFEGIECENTDENNASGIKRKFETCYNWVDVMGVLMDKLKFFYSQSDFEEDLEAEITRWLGCLEGWGLLFTLLPFEIQQYFLLMYAHLNIYN